MGRVVCISSQTVYGPVGNSAAMPALQELGHEVMALPTVVLSNHPGHGKPVGQVTPADLIAEMLSALAGLGAFNALDAVMTGYFANASQVIVAAKQIESLAKLNHRLHVLVDPVIGDHGALYVAEDVATAIRDHLLPIATITTPNIFELEWLSGVRTIADAVKTLNVAETIVTSVPQSPEQLATRLYLGNAIIEHVSVRHRKVSNGTGDFLAGCYLAQRLTQPPDKAFAAAMARLDLAIAKSVGSVVLLLN